MTGQVAPTGSEKQKVLSGEEPEYHKPTLSDMPAD
jgi:hypothetical protein